MRCQKRPVGFIIFQAQYHSLLLGKIVGIIRIRGLLEGKFVSRIYDMFPILQ